LAGKGLRHPESGQSRALVQCCPAGSARLGGQQVRERLGAIALPAGQVLDETTPHGAGDEVTFDKMIVAYRQVYGVTPRSMKLPGWLFANNSDLGKMLTWLSKHGYRADIAANRKAIPGILTYEQFIAKRRMM